MNTFLNRHKTTLILMSIILVQLLWITYTFHWQREGFHPDESWSYCFANANNDTALYEDSNGLLKNFNSWIDSHTFRDFIEVQKGREFSFDSVFVNMSKDFNPPLHSLLLHAVSSFAPETFSWWYAYIINVFAFLLAMISLYFFGKEYLHSSKCSFVLCAFYGSTTAALNTFVYLRIYPLLTAFAILMLYLHCKLFHKHYKSLPKILSALFCTAVLGYMGHYYFFILAFFLSAFFSLVLLIQKRRFDFYAYAGTMLSSVIVTFLFFPRAMVAMTIGTNYIEQAPLLWEIKECFYMLFGETTGIPIFTSLEQFVFVLIFALLFIAAFSFLMRKEHWYYIVRKKMYIFFRRLTQKRFSYVGHTIKMKIKKWDLYSLSLLFTLCCTLITIADISTILHMGIYSDRYLFMLMPMWTAIFVKALISLCRKICNSKRLAAVVLSISLLVCLILNHILFPCNYLLKRFDEPSNTPLLAEITKNAEVILITSLDWHLVFYSTLLKDSNYFFALKVDDWMTHMDSLDQLPSNSSPVYLIIEQDYFRSEDHVRQKEMNESMRLLEDITKSKYAPSDIATKFSTLHWSTKAEYLHTENSFCGNLSVWQLR